LRWQDYLWLLLLGGSYLALYLFGRKKGKKRKKRPRSERPLTRREQQAWHKLQAGGYRLAEIHPEHPVIMTVDGNRKNFSCAGNFIVSRDGELFLVKIIKGEEPLHWPALRRELLLDTLFFRTDGVFFYLEAKEQLQEIRFSFNEPAVKKQFLLRAALVLLLAIGAAFLGHLLSSSGLF
jgi:hypothetical protein